jgi:hypothetical protein
MKRLPSAVTAGLLMVNCKSIVTAQARRFVILAGSFKYRLDRKKRRVHALCSCLDIELLAWWAAAGKSFYRA